MSARTASASTFAVFVSQAYPPQPHHRTQITSSPRPNPAQVGCSSHSVVTCVNANTNTRSKKSSSVETRCSLSTRRLLTQRGLHRSDRTVREKLSNRVPREVRLRDEAERAARGHEFGELAAGLHGHE